MLRGKNGNLVVERYRDGGRKRPAVLKRGCLGGRPKEGKNYYYLPKTLAKSQVSSQCSGPEGPAGSLVAGSKRCFEHSAALTADY